MGKALPTKNALKSITDGMDGPIEMQSNMTPSVGGMDAVTMIASVSDYHGRRQAKKAQWDQRRAELIDTLSSITSGPDNQIGGF